MEKREYLRLWARSPVGIGSAALALAAGAAVGAAGAGLPLAILGAALAYGAALAASLVVGWGPRAAVAEAERETAAAAAARIREAAEAKRKLAVLRLADPEVAAARDLAVLEADKFLEACRSSESCDPVGAQAIADCVDIAGAWMREADASSTERRFGMPDADPFPDAAQRSAAALRDKAALISGRRSATSGEAPPSERLEIEEELR